MTALAPASPASPNGSVLLEARDITKRYEGISALSSVSVDVGHGDFVGLIGPNGAGKTTLFDCLLGKQRPDIGTVTFAGQEIQGLPGHLIARKGIVRTFQHVRLFKEMTAVENLLVAQHRHLNTGFLATPYLLPVLAEAGHLDVAYELLLQDTPPSWLAMVDRGATTVWESWEGIDDDGEPHASLNHYSKGAVISFLHTHTAGIQLLDDHPAYRRFRVAPQPGGGLTWAESVHDSPYGRIESSWRIVPSGRGQAGRGQAGRGQAGRGQDRFQLTVTVPPGTTAEIELPDGTRAEQHPGLATYDCGA